MSGRFLSTASGSPAWKRAQASVFAILGDDGTVSLNQTLDQAYVRLPDTIQHFPAAE